jgi:hypothetical protein
MQKEIKKKKKKKIAHPTPIKSIPYHRVKQ